jgi:hypothetical protein
VDSPGQRLYLNKCTQGAGWVHFTFPEAHRRQIRSTNPLERLNNELTMGIEDRRREDLRRSARTATGADVLPEDLCQKIQHRIAHRKRGVVVQVETVAVELAASVVTLLWLVIAFTGARDQHLANLTVLSAGERPSQHCRVLTLRSRCFGVSRLPRATRLRPEQW